MATLYAGIWVGEFGWELFCWQGYLRKLAKKYDNCVVACRAGHEMLYEDFAETMPHYIESEECDMWQCKGYKSKTFPQCFDRMQKPQDVWIKPSDVVVRYDHTHKLDSNPPFNKFKEQEFVKYGSKPEKTYDIVFHARSKKNKVNAGMNSDYRNWTEEKWNSLVKMFPEKTFACIGTEKSALHVAGDDLRGSSLRNVCDVLSQAKVIVGPSSGPIHLAALCGTPQVIWYGDPYDESNEQRYKKDWNPFDAPVEIIRSKDWTPSAENVAKAIRKIIK